MISIVPFCKVSEGSTDFGWTGSWQPPLQGRPSRFRRSSTRGRTSRRAASTERGDETPVRVRYAPKDRPVARRAGDREGALEGGFTVTHRVVDPHRLVRHVLQYGSAAEVLEARGVVGGSQENLK